MRNFIAKYLIPLPLKALRSAGPLLISYLAILFTALFCCIKFIAPYITSYLNKAFDDFELPHSAFLPSLIALRSIGIFLLLPVALVAVVLPLRFVWLSGGLTLKELLADTLPAMQRALSALYFATCRIVASFVPAISMYVVYILSIKDAESPEVQKLFFFTSACVAAWTLLRVVPLTAPVFIAIGGKLNAHQSIQLAHAMPKTRASQLFFWQLSAIIIPLLLCAFWQFPQFNWHTFSWKNLNSFLHNSPNNLELVIPSMQLSSWQLATLAIMIWFCVAQMAFTTFQGVADLAKQAQAK